MICTSPDAVAATASVGVQEPADRAHQPRQRLAVHLIGAAEPVDDPRARHTSHGVALVLRQRQV
jgi:hypothetical protein